MKIERKKVKKILVITLSNIGDAILTTPVIQTLRNNFPQAHLAVLVGPRAFAVFKNNRQVNKRIIYDKALSWKNKWALVNRLRLDRYDLVVDLRQTFFANLLGVRYCTSLFARPAKSVIHMKSRHLWKLKSLGLVVDDTIRPRVEFNEDEQNKVNQIFAKWQKRDGQVVVALAPGARNMTKRWESQGYRELIERLIKERKAKIVIVGDQEDKVLAQEINAQIRPALLNCCGQTSIGELACLLSKCRLLVSNDSAPMHLAWAVGTPVVSIFGPTDYRKYAPGGLHDIVVRKDLSCSPCEQSLCPKGTRECMKLISVDDVFGACKRILEN